MLEGILNHGRKNRSKAAHEQPSDNICIEKNPLLSGGKIVDNKQRDYSQIISLVSPQISLPNQIFFSRFAQPHQKADRCNMRNHGIRRGQGIGQRSFARLQSRMPCTEIN